MKKLNILFAFVLTSCALLSFVVPNNLTQSEIIKASVHKAQPDTQDLSDTLTFVDLNRMMTKEVLNPLRDCFEKKEPDMFMTKCYTRIEFRLDADFRDRMLFTSTPVRGSIVFVDCSVPTRIADVEVTYAQKEIRVRESFRHKTVGHKQFIKDFCSYVDKSFERQF